MDSAKRGARVLLYVSAQFFILTLIAMAVYPGGTYRSPDASRYWFTQNFFSDLGATQTFSGKPNIYSETLFIVALGSIGLSLMFTSGIWKSIGRRSTGLGTAAQVFAVLAGACFVGIAGTPWNIFLHSHNFFVKCGFSLLLGMMGSLVLFQQQNHRPGIYVWSNWVYVVLLVSYVWILFYGPSLHTLEGLQFQVVAQKIIVYASILNLAVQAYGIRSVESAGQNLGR